ncbi:UDP-N-acetylmuramoyl-L-alanine--D-glutamate ligase [soil metagenome]
MSDWSTPADLAGKRVTVLGLGVHGGGIGVARFFAEQGAIVTVTDAKPADALQSSVDQLAGLDIRFVLGEHHENDFSKRGADMVIRNPSVPRRAALLERAREEGVPVEMEMSLFLRFAPGPVIGVTGTKGKTTTSNLLALMLQDWKPETRIAGNMGIPALSLLPGLDADTATVLELSSWQLEGMDEHGVSPHIAVITNVSPDHLNTYDSYEAYAETKRRIGAHQSADDFLIVNVDDREARKAMVDSPGRVVPFGRRVDGGAGMTISGRQLEWRFDGQTAKFDVPASSFALAGEHQLSNVAAAASAALVLGAPIESVQAGIIAFDGVPNRGELVAEIDGVLYVNDTAATAPAAAIAAMERFAGQRIHLITGGANKSLDLEPLAEAIIQHAASVVLIDGSATPLLQRLLAKIERPLTGPFRGMDPAVDAARSTAQRGDVVLLSPGVASFGIFTDEFDRGEQFRSAVERLAREAVGS